jgi:hypothetical protein
MQPAAGSRVIELAARLHELAMPAVCINCGGTAAERSFIERVIEHQHSDSPTRYSVERVAVPFCPLCLDLHRREQRVTPPLTRIAMMYKSSVMYGATCQAALALFFLTRGNTVTTVVAAFLFLLAAICARIAFNETRYAAVSPATSVSGAFRIGDDASSMFEPERRLYTMRNPRFAEAFIAVNRERIWDPASPQAQRAANKRSFAIAVFIVLAVGAVAWGIYDEYFSD